MEFLKNYIKSIVNFYGVVSLEFFLELYNEHNQKCISKDDIILLLDDNFKSNDIFVVDNENIVKMDIYTDKEYYEFLLSATKNKPYYHISAQQLKNYSDSTYYEKNQEYIKLYSYLKRNFNKSDEILNNLLCDIAIFSRKYTDVTGMMNILKTEMYF